MLKELVLGALAAPRSCICDGIQGTIYGFPRSHAGPDVGFKIPLLGWVSIVQPDRGMGHFLSKVIRMTKKQGEYGGKHFAKYNICSVLGILVRAKRMGLHGIVGKPRTRKASGQDFSCPLVFLGVRREVGRSD